MICIPHCCTLNLIWRKFLFKQLVAWLIGLPEVFNACEFVTGTEQFGSSGNLAASFLNYLLQSEHKIQSRDGPLRLSMHGVPKMLSHWSKNGHQLPSSSPSRCVCERERERERERVCVCVCVYVCHNEKKVPDEWEARQAIPAIFQVCVGVCVHLSAPVCHCPSRCKPVVVWNYEYIKMLQRRCFSYHLSLQM